MVCAGLAPPLSPPWSSAQLPSLPPGPISHSLVLHSCSCPLRWCVKQYQLPPCPSNLGAQPRPDPHYHPPVHLPLALRPPAISPCHQQLGQCQSYGYKLKVFREPTLKFDVASVRVCALRIFAEQFAKHVYTYER